jgi:hypothetical protein
MKTMACPTPKIGDAVMCVPRNSDPVWWKERSGALFRVMDAPMWVAEEGLYKVRGWDPWAEIYGCFWAYGRMLQVLEPAERLE